MAYRVVYSDQLFLDLKYTRTEVFTISPNQAKINDTTTTFYGVKGDYDKIQTISDNILSSLIFTLSDEYDVYEPYINYQPVINSNRRNLNSINRENIMPPHYFMFYFLSQIGGIYAFLMLFLGYWVKSTNQTSLMFSLINDFNKLKIKNAKTKRRKNIDRSRLTTRRSANIQNKRNAKFKKRNSMMNQSIESQNEGGSSSDQSSDEIEHSSSSNEQNRELQYRQKTLGLRSDLKRSVSNRRPPDDSDSSKESSGKTLIKGLLI